jgi:hypothetical protein
MKANRALFTFFGGGLALFVNLFIPFLHGDAYAVIALIIMAEFVVLLVVGKAMQMISALRSLRDASAATRDDPEARD